MKLSKRRQDAVWFFLIFQNNVRAKPGSKARKYLFSEDQGFNKYTQMNNSQISYDLQLTNGFRLVFIELEYFTFKSLN